MCQAGSTLSHSIMPRSFRPSGRFGKSFPTMRRSISVRRVKARPRRGLSVTEHGIKSYSIVGTTDRTLVWASSSTSNSVVLFNPLLIAYQDSTFLSAYKVMHQQWRLKSVTVNIRFTAASTTVGSMFSDVATVGAQNYSGLQFYSAWDRA